MHGDRLWPLAGKIPENKRTYRELPEIEGQLIEIPKGDTYDVVELGSGTGKFTVCFLRRVDRPIKYLATEPLANMLGIIKENCPEVATLQCAAEKLDLPDSSVKMIVAAQSFHWFANLTSLAEIHRVLIPGGQLVMIFHSRDVAVPWIREVGQVIDGMYRDAGVEKHQSKKWKRIFEKFQGFGDILHASVPAPSIKGSMEEILVYFSTQSVLSSSAENMNMISEIIRGHPDLQGDSDIIIPYVTDVYWCSKQLI